MVQRKVSNNIHPKTTLKTDSIKHVTLKPSLQNHDAKTKLADLKTIKMKKSRSIKRPADVELSRRPSTKTRLGEPPPTKTPSPKKPLCSPNYMKSTSSSELHKVGKTKTNSLMNKVVRTLTRAPSFKHSKTLGTKTHYFDVKRATCSSTLKDYKFPSYLKLTHGSTEGKGTSVMKVCPYTYCSLNGHHHNPPAPPLKSFLSSRRKMLKTPRQARNSKAGFVSEERKDEFFVEIHVPRHDEPEHDDRVSDISFEGDVDQSSESFNNESDIEWVEGYTQGFGDEKVVEVLVSKDCGGDEFEPGFEFDGEVLPNSYDEIVEFMMFSDVDTASDNESTHTETVGDHTAQQTVVEESIEEVTKADNEGLDSFEEQNEASGYVSNEEMYMLEEITDEDTADNVTEETRSSDVLVEDIPWEASLIADNILSEVAQSEVENADDVSQVNEDKLFLAEDVADSSVVEAVMDQNDAYSHNIGLISKNYEEEHDSSEVKLESIETDIEEVEPLPAIRNSAEGVNEGISRKGNDSIDDLLDFCSKLKKSVRRKEANEESEEDRDFNPRPPNFLPVEPEPEAEKVDLRHQDMDERRNAEDWMLDHALQKTVNQLAPARKKKVALLVEAFETVLPIPKYEPLIRRNLTVFSHARPAQACR